MVESLAARIARILSASVADLVDRMEAAQAEIVMKETIREVAIVIDETRVEVGRFAAKRLQAVRQAQMTRDKIADLQDRAREALAQSREDLAQAAIARQIDLEAQLAALGAAEEDAAKAEARFEQDVAALLTRKQEMEENLNAFVAAQREADAAAPAGGGAKPDRRVENSVATFERAMKAAGASASVAPIDVDTSKKLAELDVVLRKKQIDERLAALKAAPR